MGRIKTKWIKNVAKELVRQNPNKFNDNFENNKQVVDAMNLIPDKVVKNKICGYIIRLVSKEEI